MPHAEWITTSAAVKLYGIPASIINQAILGGTLTARTVCGELLIRRAEVTAMAVRMRFKLCENCDD